MNISKGVYLSKKLYDLVISAEPKKSFSEIVRKCLEEKYCFKPVAPDPEVNGALAMYETIEEVESIIDTWRDN